MTFEPGFVAAFVEFDEFKLGDMGFEVLVDEVARVGVLFALNEGDGAFDR